MSLAIKNEASYLYGETNQNMKKYFLSLIILALSLGFVCAQSQAKEDVKEVGRDIKKAGKSVRKETKKVAKEVAKETKKVAKEVGTETKKVGKEIGQDFKEAGKEVKKGVKSEKPVKSKAKKKT